MFWRRDSVINKPQEKLNLLIFKLYSFTMDNKVNKPAARPPGVTSEVEQIREKFEMVSLT